MRAAAVLARLTCLAMAAVVLSGGAFAADTYTANLGPMPLDAATNKNMLGRGEVSASWDGKLLTVSGRFAGLPSPATKAHLFVGPYIGVPGGESFDLTVSPADSGTLAGQIALNAKQAAAFRTGRLYVQIDSQKSPTGNLWGWLLPQHTDAPPDVPQQGPWFLPQLDTPSH
ncbi:MAG TPA: CHRD domain-containing protein [Rhizomicrobium sp.]|nr:CHRD domain-containing protein [Rhizomicrobium sp.]